MKKSKEFGPKGLQEKKISQAYAKLRQGGGGIYLRIDISNRSSTRDWLYSWSRGNILFDSNQSPGEDCSVDFIRAEMQQLGMTEVVIVFAINYDSFLTEGIPFVAVVRPGEEEQFAEMKIKILCKQDISQVRLWLGTQDILE